MNYGLDRKMAVVTGGGGAICGEIARATGEITERGRQIIRSVPMARYGRPREITGAALWLLSEQSSFVTGAVIPVDGGLTAFSGV